MICVVFWICYDDNNNNNNNIKEKKKNKRKQNRKGGYIGEVAWERKKKGLYFGDAD